MKHARKIENLRVKDQTDFYLDHKHAATLKPILEGSKSGLMCINLIKTKTHKIGNMELPNYRGEWTLREVE